MARLTEVEKAEAVEMMNDLRRCGEIVCKAFKDNGSHYEYTGSMNDVEDLRDAVARARAFWLDKMVR